jgi:carbon storage regulator CsrA
MLILTRRVSEEVIAHNRQGLHITFTILAVNGNQVRVGIECRDRNVIIDRKEVWVRKQNEIEFQTPRKPHKCDRNCRLFGDEVEGVGGDAELDRNVP